MGNYTYGGFWNYTYGILVVLVVFQFAIQETYGNYYGTTDIERAQTAFNSGSTFSQKLKDIAQEFGCLCDHNGAEQASVAAYCQAQDFWGTAENLLWNNDWQEASSLQQWIDEGPGGGHYDTMVNAQQFGCYLADGCGCGWTYTVRCVYCTYAGWQG